MKNKKQVRNLKGQFTKEEPYSRIASLCGFILIIAGVGITLLNICRVDNKIETTIRLDREMIEYTRQIVVAQEQQAQAEKSLAESVEEVKKEVKEVKTVVKTIKAQNDYLKIEEAAKKVCSEKGFGKSCVADILGISYAEHHDFDCSKVGDNNSSFGCFQIYRKVHKSITVEQANDIEWSARWTLNRLISKGYGKYRSYAIRCHNGNPFIPKTKAYLDTVNKFVNQY